MVTYKALDGLAPKYISDMLMYNQSSYHTRASTDPLRLYIPKTSKHTFADRAFSVAAPKLWNNIPLDIRVSKTIESFKQRLKTYLFENVKMFQNC